jgi:hypothetical protein
MQSKEHLAQLLWDLNVLNTEGARLVGVTERTMYRWLAGTTPIPYAPIRVLELLLERKRAKISVDEPEAVV